MIAYWLDFALHTLTLFFMLIGLAGLIMPVFPGLTVIWLVALGYALIRLASDAMNGVGWLWFALISVLMLVGNVVDNLIIARRMREHAIPWRNILLSYVLGIGLSIIATPLIGLIGTPLALVGLEYWRLRQVQQAIESARAYLIGWGIAFFARLGIGMLMIAIWMVWAFG